MNPRFPLLALTCALLSSPAHGETVKDREGAVRKDRAALEYDARWIYNDFNAGFAKAKQTGKPLLVVLRCVPCLSCAGIDAQVLEDKVARAAAGSVRVRAGHQCERAGSLAVPVRLRPLALGDVLQWRRHGRTGATARGRTSAIRWTNRWRVSSARWKARSRFTAAIRRTRRQLAGKQGGPMPFKTPVEIPRARRKVQDGTRLGGQGRAELRALPSGRRRVPRFIPRQGQGRCRTEWIYPFPQPETIGLTLAPDHAARVETVAPGSHRGGGGTAGRG